MPQVKEVNGRRPTRSAGKTAVEAPVATPGKPGRPAPKAATRAAVRVPQAKPVTAAPGRKSAAKVAVAPAKAPPRVRKRTLAKANGRAGDESRRSTTSKKVKGKAPGKVGRKAAPASRKGGKKLPIGKVKPEPVRGVKIRELNPQEKCGPGTSVLQLFRVDESLGRELTTHLVFFDRHGWYCEHGRTCRAVADVQKLGKRMVVGL